MSINWPVKKLGEVLLLIQNGINPKQGEIGNYPISRIETLQNNSFDSKRVKYADLNKDEFEKYKYEIGDIAFSHINSYEKLGKVALYNGEIKNLVHGVNLLRLKTIKNICLPDYLFAFMQAPSLRAQLGPYINMAVNQASINQTSLKKTLIPIPPINIQKKIVERLDAIRKAQELNDLQITKTEELFESLVFKELEDLEIESQSLSKVCSFQYGYTQSAQNVGQYRFIRITDINEYGEIREDDEKFISDDIELLKPYILNKGDLLLARTGATYGKILHFSLDQPSVFASFLIRIIPDKSKVLPGYIWLFSRSRNYWNQAKRLVSGTGQPQFNANKIKEIKIKIPNLGAQQEIVGKLEAVQDYKKLLQKQKLLLKELFDSVLDKSMKGEMDN